MKERICLAANWHGAGNLPIQEQQTIKKECQYVKGIHTDNLHHVLDVMMSKLVQIQQEGGLLVDICLTGDGVHVWKQVLFPVAFVMGDCKGNDALAGRYGSHAKGVRRISRACNCQSKKANDPNFRCQYVKQADIQTAVESKDLYRLKELSQHNIQNAFHNVDFGGDPHSIYGCTPVDIVVHVSQLGLFKYIMKVFSSRNSSPSQIGSIFLFKDSTVFPSSGPPTYCPGRTMAEASQIALG